MAKEMLKPQLRSTKRSARILAWPLHAFLQGISSAYLGGRKVKNTTLYWCTSGGAPTARSISTDVNKLSKKPGHLSAILQANNVNKDAEKKRLVQEAVDLAAWSIAAGIRIASVYERQGLLKDQREKLHEAIELRLAQIFPTKSPEIKIFVNDEQDVPPASPNSEKTGADIPSLSLYLISEEDGRGCIEIATEKFTEQVHSNKVRLEDISVDLVARELHEATMPPPDLIVIFGPSFKLQGYPPWHLQCAEISSLRDNCRFGYVPFLHALKHYADAEMRNGK